VIGGEQEKKKNEREEHGEKVQRDKKEE